MKVPYLFSKNVYSSHKRIKAIKKLFFTSFLRPPQFWHASYASASKNHTGGLEGTGKIFSQPGSARCPVQVIIKTFLSHLNPDINALFQRPKELSSKFNPKSCIVWYDARKLGHNSLENVLKNMTTNAEISPYLTNHSLRATTVTVLSSQNFETRNIKAITGHRSDTSIESYCKRPTLNQFKEMSTALTHFVGGDENQPPVN